MKRKEYEKNKNNFFAIRFSIKGNKFNDDLYFTNKRLPKKEINTNKEKIKEKIEDKIEEKDEEKDESNFVHYFPPEYTNFNKKKPVDNFKSISKKTEEICSHENLSYILFISKQKFYK